MLILALLSLPVLSGACARSEGSDPSQPDPSTDPEPDTATVPDPDTATTETDTTESSPPVDCSAPLVSGPLPFEDIAGIRTEEDFDFDGEGRLIAQDNRSLVGYRLGGGIDVISPVVGLDAAGVRALPDGNYVVVLPASGTLKWVDGQTGAVVDVATNLQQPNGAEVSRTGTVYVGEFPGRGGLWQIDPATGDGLEIVDGWPINGLALTPDEQTLYVSTHAYIGSSFDGIAALDRDPATGAWSTPRPVVSTGSLMQGLVTDVCANLYAVESSTGDVYRIAAATGAVERIAELEHVGSGTYTEFFSSMRFGNGRGGWSRTTLYVTDRTRIYAIDVGIEGRHVLAE